MTTTQVEPRIYVASLAAYNAGKLYGQWINAGQGTDGIWEDIKAMLAKCPEHGEEHAIHDYEGFGPLRLSENESMARIAELAEAIEEHGEIFAHYVHHVGGEPSADDFAEHYRGVWKSLEDYAYEFVRDTGDKIPEHLENYIDYAKMGHDWELGGDIFTIQTGFDEVHIFDNH